MIYLFLAEGFEEIEALTPLDILRRAGKDVRTVGVGGSTIRGSHGIPVVCDTTIDAVSLADAPEAVILPGGMPGTNNLECDDTVRGFVRAAYRTPSPCSPYAISCMSLFIIFVKYSNDLSSWPT